MAWMVHDYPDPPLWWQMEPEDYDPDDFWNQFIAHEEDEEEYDEDEVL